MWKQILGSCMYISGQWYIHIIKLNAPVHILITGTNSSIIQSIKICGFCPVTNNFQLYTVNENNI